MYETTVRGGWHASPWRTCLLRVPLSSFETRDSRLSGYAHIRRLPETTNHLAKSQPGPHGLDRFPASFPPTAAHTGVPPAFARRVSRQHDRPTRRSAALKAARPVVKDPNGTLPACSFAPLLPLPGNR